MFKNKTFLQRLQVACVGIGGAFREEKNFRIQLMVAIIVIGLMVLLGLGIMEQAVLLLTIVVVLTLELINSQIERFLDVIEPNYHEKVKRIKDFSAGAVLISALGSLVIGTMLFWPHVIALLR